MDLNKYNEKRDFDLTTEPQGVLKKAETKLIFVVQKHAASHLNCDFWLERDGDLKSGVLPGPSMNPAFKRLALLVEDHFYSYKDFEGCISKGNYGAGRVLSNYKNVISYLIFD